MPAASAGEPAAVIPIAQPQPVAEPPPAAEPEAGSALSPAGLEALPAATDAGGARSWLAALRLRLSRPKPLPTSTEVVEPRVVVEPGTEYELPAATEFNPLLASQAAAATSSNDIFIEIGQQLQQRREMLSLTYEEIERHTHVREAFLAALERGALEDLPSPVQTRGILVNYATFLDLDVDRVLLRFADGLQARHREKGPQKKTGRKRPPMRVHTTLPPLRAFVASDLVFGGGLAIMLLLFAVWGISRVMAVRSETQARATPPPISDVLMGTALPTIEQQVTVIPAEETPIFLALEASPTLELATLDPNVNVQVKLTASERTYIRVTIDGKLKFEGRTDPGEVYTYQGAEQIEIVAGNAAALQVNYNERDLGLMGNFGEVVDRLYTAEGVATPTSTPPPTRTPTPIMTATHTETPTRTPTGTPKP